MPVDLDATRRILTGKYGGGDKLARPGRSADCAPLPPCPGFDEQQRELGARMAAHRGVSV